MAFSDFFIGYTPVSLYSQCYLCSHSELVTQTTATLHKKLYCVNNNKIFHIGVTFLTKIMSVAKNLCCGNKKKYMTPKKETHVD